jgi:hypothetical protein
LSDGEARGARISKAVLQGQTPSVKGVETLEPGRTALAATVLQRVFPKTRAPPGGRNRPGVSAAAYGRCKSAGSVNLTYRQAIERDGNWLCFVRETRGSAEIEIVGLGTGHVVALELLEAPMNVTKLKDARKALSRVRLT